MFHTTVKCVDCGTVMVDVPGNTKRCAVCRVGHNRESVRKANEAERRAVLDRQTVQGLWWAIGFVSKIPAACMSEKELNHAIRLTRFRGAVCPVFQA